MLYIRFEMPTWEGFDYWKDMESHGMHGNLPHAKYSSAMEHNYYEEWKIEYSKGLILRLEEDGKLLE